MKRKIITSLLSIALLSQTAYAEITYEENPDTRLITVSGILDGTEQTNIISMEIKNQSGDIIYQSAFPTKSGEVDYSFKLSENIPTGIYTMYFDSYGTAVAKTVMLNYVSTNDTVAILNSVNSLSHGEIVGVIEKYHTELGISQMWYEKLTDSDKEAMAKSIYDGRGEAGYATVQPIKDIIISHLFVDALWSSENADDVAAAFSEFEVFYAFSENVDSYAGYETLSAENQNKVKESIAKSTGETKEDIYKVFEEAIFLNKIINAKQPGDILQLIEDNTDIIDFDLTTYNISNKTSMGMYLFGKEYVVMKDLENMIISGYEAQKRAENPVVSGGSSGGGGSSSGGSSSKGSSSVINLPTPSAPVVITEEKSLFTDLDGAAWAEEAINYLAGEKIISGLGDGVFAPGEKVTREQFVLMLANAFNFLNDTASAEFEDIDSRHWAYNAVASAYESGIVNGIGENKFGVGLDITRQDMAVMTVLAAEKNGYSFDGDKDTKPGDMDIVSEYAKNSVGKMLASGVINGYAEDNTFRPFENATRAQAAQVIYTIIKGGK